MIEERERRLEGMAIPLQMDNEGLNEDEDRNI